jgi:hypothetical protein
MHRLCTNGERPLDLKKMSGFELLSAMVEGLLPVPYLLRAELLIFQKI